MKLKLPDHIHLPTFRAHVPKVKLCRRKCGRFMMKYGAFAMVFDGIVRIGALALGIHIFHEMHDLANIIGPNGAAIAGLGALLDMAESA